jgi:hypothetical protein
MKIKLIGFSQLNNVKEAIKEAFSYAKSGKIDEDHQRRHPGGMYSDNPDVDLTLCANDGIVCVAKGDVTIDSSTTGVIIDGYSVPDLYIAWFTGQKYQASHRIGDKYQIYYGASTSIRDRNCVDVQCSYDENGNVIAGCIYTVDK